MKEHEKIGLLLASARHQACKSQDAMSELLNRNVRTIRRWEEGSSCPSVSDFVKWFKVLGMNPIPSFMAVVRPDLYWQLSKSDPDKNISAVLHDIIDTLNPIEQRRLIYILAGKHGASYSAVLNLMVTFLHISLSFRYFFTKPIVDAYKMHGKLNQLINTENVLPDIDELEKTLDQARRAIEENKSGYVDFEFEENENETW